MGILEKIATIIKTTPNYQELGAKMKKLQKVIVSADAIVKKMENSYYNERYTLKAENTLTFYLAGYQCPDDKLREYLESLGFEELYTDDDELGRLLYYCLKD